MTRFDRARFRDTFDAEQWAAVEEQGDVVVAAAAGSGKTRVLVGRIVHAVCVERVELPAIVAVTFTERAAAEMRRRLADRFQELGELELVAQLEHAQIGTIHSLCARILREHPLVAGVDPAFTVLDEARASYLRHHACMQALETAGDGDMAITRLRARYSDAVLRRFLAVALDAMGQRLDGAVHFAGSERDEDGRAFDVLLDACVASYERAKHRSDGLDFDDLQRRALTVLDDAEVIRAVRSRVLRVLVDEFQDTNEVQCAILERIAGGQLFTVGDEWQSIYRFRGADVGVFRERARRLDTLPVAGNYRSTRGVIDIVNHVFAPMFGDRYRPIDARGDHLDPDVAQLDPDVACELVLVPKDGRSADDARAAEAAIVAGRIRSMIDAGVDPGAIAVLMVANTRMRGFERALRDVGVPAIAQSSRGFFDAWEVRDTLALLAWSVDRHDDAAALGVLASSHGCLEWGELLEIRSLGGSIWEGLWASAEADERYARALRLRDEVATVAENGQLVDAVDHAIFATEFHLRVAFESDGRARLANLRKLIELAASAPSVGAADVAAFTEMVRAQRDVASREGAATVADEASGAVRIMTIHKSKGLEFQHVFLADLGTRPPHGSARALLDRRSGMILTERRDADGAERIRSEAFDELRAADAAETEEERQRLLYVGMTRACGTVHLSGIFDTRGDGSDLTLEGPLRLLCPVLDVDPITVGTGWRHPNLPLVAICNAGSTMGAPVAGRDGEVPSEVRPVWPGVDLPSLASTHRGDRAVQRSPSESSSGMLRARGSLLHAALAMRLDDRGPGAPALLDATEAKFVEAVVRSEPFRAMRRMGGRAEVDVHAMVSGQLVDVRMDALAIDGGEWSILDYKLTLPSEEEAAWRAHAPQLAVYALVALAAGAGSVTLTLLSIRDPSTSHRWRFDASQRGELERELPSP